jgi:hypothetical protein
LTPILPIVFVLITAVYFVVVALYIASAGEFDPAQSTYEMDDTLRYMLFYHLFVVLWTYCLIVGCFHFTIVGAATLWYYERDKKGLKFPILRAVKILLRYYIGSVCLGSLILALVKFIRIVFKYLASKMKRLKEGNQVVACILCCINCCLKCIERFIEFLNKNAYVMQVIKGKSFCTSAKDAFTMLLQNCLRVTATQWVSAVFLAFGRLFITMLTTTFAAFYMVDFDMDEMAAPTAEDSRIDPVTLVVVLILSYFISKALMEIYDAVIDATFVCYALCPDRSSSEMKKAYARDETEMSAAAGGAASSRAAEV